MFKTIKLRTQLNFGFGAVIILLIIVATTSWWGLQGASDGFAEYHRRTVNSSRVSAFQNYLLNVRLSVKSFLINPVERFSADYRQNFDAMIALLKEMQASIHKSERVEKVAAISERIAEYDKAFVEIMLLTKQRDLISERMIAIASEIQEILAKLDDSVSASDNRVVVSLSNSLQLQTLNTRYFLIKYLFSHAPEDFAKVQEATNRMGNVEKTLAEQSAGIYQNFFDQFYDQYEAFSALLPMLSQMISQINGQVKNTLDRIGPEVAKITADMQATYRTDQEALGFQVHHNNQQAIQIVVSISIAALLAGIILAWLLLRIIQRPIGGEPSKMAAITDQIASGDLTVQFTNNGKETGIYAAMRNMTRQLRDMVDQVVQATHQITAVATEIAQGSTDLSQRTEEQAAALEETASSMEELTATVKQGADNAHQADQLASAAQAQAAQGGQVVDQTVTAMSAISASSYRIADIISV
ncbi:MAG: methyl-accepting chemotaxis protein, partial [Candidatus Competibacteraceae bacterium]|nr:methyl-accepting chemotaxis protein [Candidatus Competibacteraceae bacterium]